MPVKVFGNDYMNYEGMGGIEHRMAHYRWKEGKNTCALTTPKFALQFVAARMNSYLFACADHVKGQNVILPPQMSDVGSTYLATRTS